MKQVLYIYRDCASDSLKNCALGTALSILLRQRLMARQRFSISHNGHHATILITSWSPAPFTSIANSRKTSVELSGLFTPLPFATSTRLPTLTRSSAKTIYRQQNLLTSMSTNVGPPTTAFRETFYGSQSPRQHSRRWYSIQTFIYYNALRVPILTWRIAFRPASTLSSASLRVANLNRESHALRVAALVLLGEHLQALCTNH